MKVIAADFVTSATGAGDSIPRDARPQVAFVGRSNVGKSSLINALIRRKIARTSAAPGKTRLANFYRVDVEGAAGPGRLGLYLVDLPGYGYARGADAAAELRAVAETYFGTPVARRASSGERLRPERAAKSASESERGWGPASPEKCGPSAGVSRKPAGVLLLIDSRHPSLAADVEAARWLDSMDVERQIVATKIDKLTRSERARNLKIIGDTFGQPALPFSAASGEGLDDLWRMIVTIVRDADRDV